MPPDRLKPEHGTWANSTVPPDGTVNAVLDVLAGSPLLDAAAHAGIEPTDLAMAVQVYQAAGRQALSEQAATEDWWQLYIQFQDWAEAESIAADHLAPLLCRSESDGAVIAWWFVRKHPCWRVRLRIAPLGSAVQETVAAALDDLATAGRIHRWWTGTYEPETAAFGNTIGMKFAHELFHADSRAILALHHHTGDSRLGRRELSILLCSSLLRAAGLEWYEQGDVWHLIAQERPLPDDVSLDRLQELAGDLRTLMLADTTPDGPLLGNDRPTAFAADWVDTFRHVGRTLGSQARAGTLDRGLRAILAYHVIFHWNRLGLPTRKQSVLAWAARTAILGPSPA